MTLIQKYYPIILYIPLLKYNTLVFRLFTSMVLPFYFEGRKIYFFSIFIYYSIFYYIFVFYFVSTPPRFSIILLIYCKRLTIRHSTLGFIFLEPKPALEALILDLTFTSIIVYLQNKLFQEFIKIFIKKILVLMALIAPVIITRDDSNRLIELWNPNIYYCYLDIQCYYFCQ